jgi:hypothetical protein
MKSKVTLFLVLVAGVSLAAAGASCSSDSSSSSGTASGGANAGGGNAGGGNAGGANAGGGTYTGSGGAPTEIKTCQGKIYACGDLEDNDDDGLIDSQDPDCLGPCDNTEDSYYGGIPGQNNAPCKMDCYFDQDTGSGNDGCYWNHECDPNSVSPNYYPEPANQCEYDLSASTPGTPLSCAELDQSQSTLCLDYCGPLTPNGCDCFGCCELPAESGSYVWLGSIGAAGDTVCSIDSIGDPDLCHPCKPVAACLNDCGHCELCLGKTELPADCFDPPGTGGGGGAGGGGSPQDCPPEFPPCGLEGQAQCPINSYCLTGCCVPVPT